MRIGARHDDELVVDAAVGGGLQPVTHLAGLDQRLAGTMAAALDRDLVFEVAPRGTRPRHLANGARNHERAAPPGVGVDEQRHIGCRSNAADVLADVIERRHREIREAERRIRNARAGKIDGFEAGSLGQQCRVGVDSACDL